MRSSRQRCFLKRRVVSKTPKFAKPAGLLDRSVSPVSSGQSMTPGRRRFFTPLTTAVRTSVTPRLKKSKNKDWEDLASFTLDGDPYLMVADIGDNAAKRKSRRLYFLKEPKAGKKSTTVDWEVEFEYPNGPRDAEAAAIDIENERVLILSKRDIPPVVIRGSAAHSG